YMKPHAGSPIPAHSHLPAQSALDMIGTAFKNSNGGAANGIKVHFDVGANYPGDEFVIPATKAAAIPLARGGDIIDEIPCVPDLSPMPPKQPHNCEYINYPGTVSWKKGFWALKQTYFERPKKQTGAPDWDEERKDIFHYAVFAHALALPRW